MKKRRSLFITFEGIEGSGKSTIACRTVRYLRTRGKKVLMLREPGGTRIGEKIRRMVLDKRNGAMVSFTELLLYNAARAQLVREVIRPALRKGQVVVCDRFTDSTIAYQCFGGGVNRDLAHRVNTDAAMNMKPDITFIFDCDVKEGLRRSGRRDRMERKTIAFHRRVQKGFVKIAGEDRKRCVLVQRGLTLTELEHEVKKKLDAYIT